MPCETTLLVTTGQGYHSYQLQLPVKTTTIRVRRESFPAESWGLLYDVKAIVFHRYTSIAELCFGTPWMQSLQITVLLLRRQSRRQLSQLQNDNEFPQVTLTLIPTSKLAWRKSHVNLQLRLFFTVESDSNESVHYVEVDSDEKSISDRQVVCF